MRNSLVFLIGFFSLLPSLVLAQHKGITFQAVIKKPDGTYPSVNGLTVTLQILDPVMGCVLREEEHSDKGIFNGYLNLVIGDSDATTPEGKNPSPVLSIQEVMDNSKQRAGLKCVDINNNIVDTNKTYIPSSIDRRVLRVRLNIQGEEVVADFNMRAVAFAVNSEMLNGKINTDFVNVNTIKGITQSNVESIFERFTKLDSLLSSVNGTSGAKLDGLLGRSNSTGDTLAVNITGNATTATTAATATNIAGGVNSLLPEQTGNSGKYLKTDGTNVSWEPAASGGGLTQVGIDLPTSVFTNGADITANGQVSATFTNQNAKTFFAGPSSGSGVPSFRTLTTSDLTSFDTDVDARADARIAAAKGVASGIAGLDANTKIPLTLLPNDAVFSSSVKTGTLKLVGPSSNEIQITTPALGLTSYSMALPIAAGAVGQVLKIESVSGTDLNLKWDTVTSSGGTLTSVGLSLPSTVFDVTNSPLAADGTIAANLKTQNANTVFAGPSSGGATVPGFRALIASDIPNLGWTQMTGVISSEQIASHTPSFIPNGLVMTGATNVAAPLVLSPCIGVVKSTASTFSCAPLAASDLATSIIATGHIADGAVTDAKISGPISIGKLPVASGTSDGIINQIAQSLAGVKTFLSDTIFKGSITADGNITTSADLASKDVNASGVVSADRIKVANSNAVCDTATEGSLKYNSTSKKMEFCNGTTWAQISQGVVASLMLGPPSSAIVKSGPVTFDVNYGSGIDSATINLTAGHVTIAGTATTGCSVAGVTGSGTTRTVTVNGCTGTGTVYITIAQGTANSTTGDTAPAAGPSASYLVDNSGPKAPANLALGTVPNNFTNSPTITYTAAEDVGGSAIAKHQVQIKANDGSVVKAWADHVSGTDVSGLALTFNTPYIVEVRAEDSLGNIGIVASASWTTINDPCPTNYILVPALAGYTTQDFCVAKYEMKNVSGVAVSQAAGNPWANIQRGSSAITAGSAWKACKDLGAGYDLISNAQWQTVARNIETVPENWSTGTVGTGVLARGWSAHTSNGDTYSNTAVALSTDAACLYNTGANTCESTGVHRSRRTHTLTNGKEIWDFSGNVWEWTRDNYADLGVNPAISTAWLELSGLSDTNKALFSSADGTRNSTQAIGRVYGSSAGAVRRGGGWNDGVNSGVFAVMLHDAPSASYQSVGFRCVFVP